MIGSVFHIKINSSEDNKDAGLFALMMSGASVICLDDDEYIVPPKAVDKLNERKIIYEIVIGKKGAVKEQENKEDAPKT